MSNLSLVNHHRSTVGPVGPKEDTPEEVPDPKGGTGSVPSHVNGDGREVGSGGVPNRGHPPCPGHTAPAVTDRRTLHEDGKVSGTGGALSSAGAPVTGNWLAGAISGDDSIVSQAGSRCRSVPGVHSTRSRTDCAGVV